MPSQQPNRQLGFKAQADIGVLERMREDIEDQNAATDDPKEHEANAIAIGFFNKRIKARQDFLDNGCVPLKDRKYKPLFLIGVGVAVLNTLILIGYLVTVMIVL